MLCWENLSKPKRFIQFNDLVFLGRKSIDEQREALSFKQNKTERAFSHGSYMSNLSDEMLVKDNSISLKIAIRTSEWSTDQIKAHYGFIMSQLTKGGKLWAVQTGMQLVWCNAYVTSIEHSKEWIITDDGFLVFSVEFDNPDGVWYKANESYVYLDDYSHCDFLNMKANCLHNPRQCCNTPYNCFQECECCEEAGKDVCDLVSLCDMMHNIDFLNDFFEECNSKWRVVYNCSNCHEDKRGLNELYTHAICDACVNEVLAGSFVSDTVLRSHKFSIVAMGSFKDPEIVLNEGRIKIKGDYSGVLYVNHKGEVRYAKEWDCLEFNYKEVPLTDIRFCDSPSVVYSVNNVSVEGVTSDTACIYIDYERLTL